MSFDLDKILSSIGNSNIGASRYKTIQGNRYSIEELDRMDLQTKEELLHPPTFSFDSIDKDLERLNHEYEKETNYVRRKILILKYDLMIEKFGPITKESLEIVEGIQKEILILESQL